MISFYRSRPSHRLACVKHSVSVHPEPGSNSSFNFYSYTFFIHYFNIFASSSYVFIVLANSHWQNEYYHITYSFVNYFFYILYSFFILLPSLTLISYLIPHFTHLIIIIFLPLIHCLDKLFWLPYVNICYIVFFIHNLQCNL